MNKTETLWDSLQHQQAHIEDEKAFADRVMDKINARSQGRKVIVPRWYGVVRVAASVALVVLVGFFVTMHTQSGKSTELLACNLHGMDKYRIDISHIPTEGTSRDMYRCYQEAKREQTFYHNELIKYSHENL